MSKSSQLADIHFEYGQNVLCAHCGESALPRCLNQISEIVCKECKSFEEAEIEKADLAISGRAY